MPDFFTAETVAEEPFLFVSYSHKDKEITHTMADFLLTEGVRLWYDKDLAAGDPWSTVVEGLIRHDNCRGVIFVCSPAAYISKNVHKERSIALETREKRGAANYSLFIVNVCEDVAYGSYMNLLKATFEHLSANEIDDLFPIERLHTLMNIIGTDPLSIMTGQPKWCDDLCESIYRRAKDTVDKGFVALESMQQAAGYSNVIITLGDYNGPLKWHLISRDGENGIFLLQTPLTTDYGNKLKPWLNQDFRITAFSEEELQLLIGDIRLLTISEAESLSKNILQADTAWWLADCMGSRQAEVKAEGIISKLRQLNHQFKRGVRPVISLKLENANRLINKG